MPERCQRKTSVFHHPILHALELITFLANGQQTPWPILCSRHNSQSADLGFAGARACHPRRPREPGHSPRLTAGTQLTTHKKYPAESQVPVTVNGPVPPGPRGVPGQLSCSGQLSCRTTLISTDICGQRGTGNHQGRRKEQPSARHWLRLSYASCRLDCEAAAAATSSGFPL